MVFSNLIRKVIPVAALRYYHPHGFEGTDPFSEIRDDKILRILRKFSLPPSMELWSPARFERASDEGMDEISIYEAFLVAGFRRGTRALIAVVFRTLVFLLHNSIL